MNKEFNKEIYHIHDKSYKDLYSKKEIALDLFRSQIKEPWTKEIRLEDSNKLSHIVSNNLNSSAREHLTQEHFLFLISNLL